MRNQGFCCFIKNNLKIIIKSCNLIKISLYICRNIKQIENMSNYDKIFTTLEKLNNGFLVSLHDEAKGYVFKTFKGEWKRVSFEFTNEMAGLGNINESLI